MKFSKQLITKIDAILPQTHCRQCGFAGCEPYATAIVEGRADINQCPPGSADVIRKIARLLGIEPKPLNTHYGLPKPQAVAVIDENYCIGCTFCIRSCPVDAIVGAAKQMHTVITDECTGCELCVSPCPMDCIHMLPVPQQTECLDSTTGENRKRVEQADRARKRYQLRLQRLGQKNRVSQEESISDRPVKLKDKVLSNHERKHAIVETALKRAAAVRAQAGNR